MPNIEVPDSIRGKISLIEQSCKFNGYTGGQTMQVNISNECLGLTRVKGSIKKGTFCVLYNPETMEWYKVGGNSGMKHKIDNELYGMSCSLKLNSLNDLTSKLLIVEPSIDSVCLPAIRSPHFGPTVECLQRRGDRELSLYLFSVYEVAYLHAMEMLNDYGIWIDDPNPGNIVLHRKGDSNIDVMFIDFTSSRFHASPTRKNEGFLQDKFQEHAERLICSHREDIWQYY